ncbi:hypothetical protein [Paenibacillus sp. USDA918EY]|uniref:hypothetical protein n=1 Tax=Paenibacillus sp. USDA918EY TaxID=2689575 RepID=UPI001F3894E9|nr:hypothetical protein [Paenibacillus sp. USDA918EY]
MPDYLTVPFDFKWRIVVQADGKGNIPGAAVFRVEIMKKGYAKHHMSPEFTGTLIGGFL